MAVIEEDYKKMKSRVTALEAQNQELLYIIKI